jgi:homoserine dehydrogenase
MLAAHLPEFIEMQEHKNVGMLYDASACGSIPVIRNLEEYYDNDLMKSVTGILNGSSNYILSKMYNEGLSYEVALKQAQELGFAESNPTLDVEGLDALSKLVIITVHAFGLFVPEKEIFHFGISKISAQDMQFAREKGRKIKLVAHVRKTEEGTLAMSVMPRMVTADKYIYNVEDEFNGVVIKGAFYDKQFMFGRGAGGYPTGSAVLSDITASGYDYRYEYKKMQLKNGLRFSNQTNVRIYLRYTDEKVLARLPFENVLEKHYSESFRYLIGDIQLSKLLEASEHLKTQEIFLAEF